MRPGNLVPAAILITLPLLFWECHARAASPQMWLRLEDGSTGRVIAVEPLREGEEVVYTWRNSLFRLMVTEVLVARDGRLVLTEVTYADPSGREPPLEKAADLDDLFQTGGPFRVKGISRPFTRLVFRVGEIGRPKLRIRDRVVEFAREVGFGGTVVLSLTPVE